MSSSDSSSLSSAPPTDDESISLTMEATAPITKYFKQQSPPPPKRPVSPPHEYVLADNSDIAFIVMFRARFNDVFPKSLPHYGPQDIERGVQDSTPGDHVERLLCALLSLVLNRKKDIERAHYTRPLEEAIQTHVSQWPRAWEGKNPLHGGKTFTSMSPEERLRLLKALVLWSLSSSDAIQAKIKDSYKQNRQEDDLNQPLSVQPWGRDELKRRYWLIEGQDDTHFRLYRESNPALKTNTWWSVAGSIPEINELAETLSKERSQHSKRLAERITIAIPRFEGGDEKRKRRDYRLARKAAFARPEPGFSLYEGRTRGKKLKYTYSDDEDIFSDELPPTRKSTRNPSGVSTPGEHSGPVFTASGRQVRTRAGGIYGESMLSGQRRGYDEPSTLVNGDGAARTQRSTRSRNYIDEMGDDESEAASSGNEWKGDGESQQESEEVEDAAGRGESASEEEGSQSLVVQLRYGQRNPNSPNMAKSQGAASHSTTATNHLGVDVITSSPKAPMDSVTEPNARDAVMVIDDKPEEIISSGNPSDALSTPKELIGFGDSKENLPRAVNNIRESKGEESSLKIVDPPVFPLSSSRIQNSSD